MPQTAENIYDFIKFKEKRSKRIMIYTFKKLYVFEGKEYTEIELDLEKLTGTDLLKAASDTRILLNDFSTLLESSKGYQAMIAAKACKQPVNFITNLPAVDFTKLTLLVGNFLYGMESQD